MNNTVTTIIDKSDTAIIIQRKTVDNFSFQIGKNYKGTLSM